MQALLRQVGLYELQNVRSGNGLCRRGRHGGLLVLARLADGHERKAVGGGGRRPVGFIFRSHVLNQ